MKYIFYGFLAYLFGRWTHVYLNVWFNNLVWAPHHWIYGVILMIIGAVLRKKELGKILFWIGLGLLISDFNDFLKLAFFTPDSEGPKRFFGFD